VTGDRGAEAATARASRMLVVEDDAPTREFLVDALTTQGYSVVSVADGAEAGQRLRSSPYHLLLTDIRLPGLSGLELFRLCRAAQPYTETILVTSAPDLEAADHRG